jgi:hypothetical protein
MLQLLLSQHAFALILEFACVPNGDGSHLSVLASSLVELDVSWSSKLDQQCSAATRGSAVAVRRCTCCGAQAALIAEFRLAIPTYDEEPRTKWIFKYSAQNTIVVTRTFFTQEVRGVWACNTQKC